ncbi:glycosyltransferase [Cryobacterium flavum]|nr:glycosyltransferase [Cryobacterium flavum]TFB77214.1 glycosyltransferase [Cryobacterium flavum]
MRILHVATLVTPDGAYGGPIRVAFNQADGLSMRGHTVTIAAGTRGFEPQRRPQSEQYDIRLFPAVSVPGTGFASTTAPRMIPWLRKTISNYDVVHVHLARDLVTLPAALLALRSNVPLVVQTHGMIDVSDRMLAKPVDYYVRRVLRASSRVLCLTPAEISALEQIAGSAENMQLITNGVPPADFAPVPERQEVLFLARLHKRKRPVEFVAMAARLLDRGADARFALVGPDEGEGQAVREAIAASGHPESIVWEGPLAFGQTLERMAKCSVYVLPSVGEIIPMSVLEAMSIGRPVVITESNGLADMIRSTGSGIVVQTTLDSLAAGVETLLRSPGEAHRMATNGFSTVDQNFSIAAVASVLDEAYVHSFGASADEFAR